MNCLVKLLIVLLLLSHFHSFAQTNGDREAFAETFVKIFENRGNKFDSITRFNIIVDRAFDAAIKLPGADKCVVKDNRYLAEYGFKDKAGATAFFKTLQSWLSYTFSAYKSTVRFVPLNGNHEYLQFFMSDSAGFIEAANYLGISNSKSTKPFSVHLEIDSESEVTYYTKAGIKINNPAINNLVKEVGFGNDPQMLKIKKNKKAADEGFVYESSRTLPGYKANIFEYTEEESSENKLELITKWTGEVQTVNKKVDSLILSLKAALPASYCYRIDTKRQAVFFYQHPFANDTLDASFAIHYGLNEGKKNSYFVAFVTTRTIEVEPVAKIVEQKLYPFKDATGKFGYKDATGKIIVPGKYDEAADFREEKARVVLNKRHGFIDINGKEIVPLKYEYASLFFFNGLAEVELNRKFGMVDKTGNEIVPLKYDKIDRGGVYNNSKGGLENQGGFILVKSLGKFGFIDNTGREFISLKYDAAEIFAPGMARVALNGKYGIIDNKEKVIVPLLYDFIETEGFKETGFLQPRLNGKYGLMDKTGKLVIQIKYDQLSIGFSENLSRMEVNDKFGFVDRTGKEVIPPKFENVDDFSNELAEAKLNGKWGFIDKTGKQAVEFKYESTWSFTQGLAAVELNKKWGYIDKTGKTVIPFNYDGAREFDKYGKAKVYIGKKWGRINTKGKVVETIVNEDDDDDGW